MRLWDRTRDQMGPEAREILEAEPPQDNAMGIVLEAWGDLMTCRPIGMDVGPVPWDKAMDWCDRHGLDRHASRIVWTVIQRIDRDDRERRSRPALGAR